MLTSNPLREVLHNEVHARPYEQITAPISLSHLALLTSDASASRAHLHKLLTARHLPLPAESASHISMDLGGVRLRWEQHAEFQSYTFWRPLVEGREPFDEPAVSLVSQEWLKAMPGEWLVGMHMLVTASDHLDADASHPLIKSLLDDSSLVGSSISDGNARVYTDFRLHADGFGRVLVSAGAIHPRRLGRTLQRLLEIETYRMMALLGLPVAREVAATLHSAEKELAHVAGEVRNAVRDAEPELLRQLTQLAGRVESLYANTHARFSASSAYFELVQRRIVELRETRHAGLQTLGEFLDRRLEPAMQTCAWAARRQQALSERIARTSNLLQIRVEIEQQQSSQKMLDAMNRRQKAQMLLQRAVEGLSVAAVTYYVAGLVGYIAKGVKSVDLPVSPDLWVAISIPIIAVGVWLSVRRLHQKITLDSD